MGTSLILNAHTAVKGEAVARGRCLGSIGCWGYDVSLLASDEG